MKKLFNAFLALAAGLAIAGCAKEYDDSALQSKVNDLDKKVTELEKKVNALTEQVTGLATTIDEWKKGGFVESVTDIKEGDAVIGYTVTFVGGKTVVLYNGKDGAPGKDGDPGAPGKDGENGATGADGQTPTIILYEGNLVWAIGDKPILVDNKPVPANVVPTFAINDEGHLIMTLLGQETDLGKVKGEDGAAGAGGDSILKSIEKSADGKNLVFTLNGDPEVVYEIPFATAFKLVIEKTEQEVKAGETVKIPFTIENGEGAVVDCFPGGFYSAKIEDNNVVVTVPDPFFPGHVLVWAQNDKGLYSMVKLSFITTADVVVVTPADEIEAIPAAAGEFVINLTSNVDLDAKIPEDATWISKAEVTKADYKLTLTLTENETGAPREAEISIVRKDNGQEVKTVKIVQLASTGPVAKKDVLNNAFTGIDNSGTSYQEWSDKTGASGAVYSGKSARGAAADNLSIQLRANGDEGIVSTTTGGLAKKIHVKWNSSCSAKRYLDVYGSNTAYTSVADLYAVETRGTLLGTIVRTTTDDTEGTIEVEGDYAYVGFRSRSSAMYVDEITISWEEGTPAAAETPSYNWDFASEEWQTIFGTYGSAGSDITGWNILHDGLQIVSIVDKSKYQTSCFQMGGKATLANNAVVERYFTFTAPKDGYVLVKASNTGDSAADTRLVNVTNNGATEQQVGGVPSSNPVHLVFAVKAGRVAIYPTGDGLRFYKIAFMETEPTLKVAREWGWYSGEGLWTTNVTAVSLGHPDGYGMVRGIAMDDEYIYLPKSTKYSAIAAIKITNPTTQVAGSVSGISGGSNFSTCFPRIIKNTNPEINDGNDILLLCNNTATNSDDNKLNVYAYTSGITAAPVLLCAFAWDTANNVYDWRQYGDRFSVTGNWESGKLYFPSYAANKSVILSVANGARTAVTQIAAGADNSPEGVKDIVLYAGSEDLFITNIDGANLVSATGSQSAQGWEEYTLSSSCAKAAGTYGYNFFKFNGKNWIAYARITDKNKVWLEIVEDNGDLVSSLEAQTGIMKAPVHSADNLETEHTTGVYADCAVRIINGIPYIATLSRDGGLVLDKLVFE